MLMLKTTHDRIVAAKDAALEASRQRNREIWAAYAGADREIRDLRAKLSVFTAPRKRDERGHFLPTKGAVA